MGSSSRVARTVRGLAAAVTATLVAAVFHSAGGGVFPPAPILLLALSFAVLLCIALAGRRVSVSRLVPAVAGSQALFHLVFSMGAVTAAPSHPSPLPSTTTGHGGHLLGITPSTDALGHGSAAFALDTAMTLAHLGAVLVTVLALRFGEAAFWSLLDTARLMVAPLARVASVTVPVVAPARSPQTPIDSRGFVPIARPDDLSATGLRGPPVSALA